MLDPVEMNIVGVSLLYALLMSVFMLYAVIQSRTFIDIFFVLGALLICTFSVKPIFLLLADGIIHFGDDFEPPEEIFFIVMRWVTIGSISLFLGIMTRDLLAFGGSARMGKFGAVAIERTRKGVFWLLLVIGGGTTVYMTVLGYLTIGWIGYRPEQIGLWGGMEIIAKITEPAFLVYLSMRRRFGVLGTALFVTTIVSGVAATGRADIFVFLFATVFIYHYRVRNLGGRFMFFAAFGLFFLIWITYITKAFSKQGLDILDNGVKYSNPVENLMYGSAFFPLEFLMTYSYLVERGEEAMRSMIIYVNMIAFWIPRALWEDKPLSLGTAFAADHEMVAARSWSVSIFGDSLMSGGVPLMIVNLFILGYFIQSLRRRIMNQLKKNGKSALYEGKLDSYYFFYVYMFGSSIVLFKNGIAPFFIACLIGGVTAIVLHAVAATKIRGGAHRQIAVARSRPFA